MPFSEVCGLSALLPLCGPSARESFKAARSDPKVGAVAIVRCPHRLVSGSIRSW